MTTDNLEADELRQRIEKLETEIGTLRKSLEEINHRLSITPFSQSGVESSSKTGPSQPPPPPPARPAIAQRVEARPPSRAMPVFAFPDRMKSFDYWLNRIGIGLLLFGIAFLFKYSIDQGWITPWLRIVFALLVGGVLAGLGLKLHARRRGFATVLLGGAIGTWYIAGFSAFQLLELVTHSQAMSFMVAVTLFSLAMSLRQNEPILSLIGALGGFGTPFMLYTGSGNLPGLMMYTGLLIALTGALFFFKGWKSLLWLTVICGWGVIIIGVANDNWLSADVIRAEQWAVEGGIIIGWLVFSFVPLIREWAWQKNPERWARSTLGFADKSIPTRTQELLDRHLHVLALSTPLIAYTLSIIIWPHLESTERGWSAVGIAVFYLVLSGGVHRIVSMRSVSFTNALVAIFFTTLGLTELLDGNLLLVSLATEGMALHLIASRLKSRSIRFTTHVVCLIVGCWLWSRLTDNLIDPRGFWTAPTLSDLWAIVTFGVSAVGLRRTISGHIYALITAILLCLLIVRESEGNAELILIGSEALAVYLVSRISHERPLYFLSHALFAVALTFLAVRFTNPGLEATPLLNWGTMADLSLLAISLFPAIADETRAVRWTYALLVHVALLGLFASEFSRLDNGQGWVSLIWGAYGTVLLVIGLRRNLYQFRLVAMGTLILLVAKLFIIDLARLETIWRVLLFIGVGGAFLTLSYFFPTLWKDQPQRD